MRKRAIIAVGFIFLAVFAAPACQQREDALTETVSPADSDRLSDAELRRLKEKARRGDAEAAYRVAIHYEADPEAEAEAVRWLTIAANLKHNLATQHLVVTLMERGGADCELGKVWLHRLDERVTDPQERRYLLIDDALRERCQRS